MKWSQLSAGIVEYLPEYQSDFFPILSLISLIDKKFKFINGLKKLLTSGCGQSSFEISFWGIVLQFIGRNIFNYHVK